MRRSMAAAVDSGRRVATFLEFEQGFEAQQPCANVASRTVSYYVGLRAPHGELSAEPCSCELRSLLSRKSRIGAPSRNLSNASDVVAYPEAQILHASPWLCPRKPTSLLLQVVLDLPEEARPDTLLKGSWDLVSRL